MKDTDLKMVQRVGAFRVGDMDAPNKLAVATCSIGLERLEVSFARQHSGMPLGQARLNIGVIGYGIQDARNLAWRRAEVENWEYFMFWDDDVLPPGGAVEVMLEAMEQNPEIDILGGVYPARQNVPAPIVQKQKYGAPWWGWEDGGIHKVWMTGTGFTMYRTARFKKLKPPIKQWPEPYGHVKEYFRLTDGTDDHALAIDAEKAGLSWYVHGGIVCNQIEPTGYEFDVKNARQRIGGTNGTADKSPDSAGNAGNGRAHVHTRKRKPANAGTR